MEDEKRGDANAKGSIALFEISRIAAGMATRCNYTAEEPCE